MLSSSRTRGRFREKESRGRRCKGFLDAKRHRYSPAWDTCTCEIDVGLSAQPHPGRLHPLGTKPTTTGARWGQTVLKCPGIWQMDLGANFKTWPLCDLEEVTLLLFPQLNLSQWTPYTLGRWAGPPGRCPRRADGSGLQDTPSLRPFSAEDLLAALGTLTRQVAIFLEESHWPGKTACRPTSFHALGLEATTQNICCPQVLHWL